MPVRGGPVQTSKGGRVDGRGQKDEDEQKTRLLGGRSGCVSGSSAEDLSLPARTLPRSLRYSSQRRRHEIGTGGIGQLEKAALVACAALDRSCHWGKEKSKRVVDSRPLGVGAEQRAKQWNGGGRGREGRLDEGREEASTRERESSARASDLTRSVRGHSEGTPKAYVLFVGACQCHERRRRCARCGG